MTPEERKCLENETEIIITAASHAIGKSMLVARQSGKHGSFSWYQERTSIHELKAIRHVASAKLCGVHVVRREHLENAICRLAMIIASEDVSGREIRRLG